MQACTSSRLNDFGNSVDVYKFFYKCLERESKQIHFFSNSFNIEPTQNQKKHHKHLGKIEIEEQINGHFEWCKVIPESEVNPKA